LFAERLEEQAPGKFDINKAIVTERVSPVREVYETRRLHLLCSSLKLIDIQDRLITISEKNYGALNYVTVLKNALQPVINEYDIVLIDCPRGRIKRCGNFNEYAYPFQVVANKTTSPLTLGQKGYADGSISKPGDESETD
jgi:cellulose biosynthesis protein BcsQ